MERDAVLERESASDLVCKVLERENERKKAEPKRSAPQSKGKACCHLGSDIEEELRGSSNNTTIELKR